MKPADAIVTMGLVVTVILAAARRTAGNQNLCVREDRGGRPVH